MKVAIIGSGAIGSYVRAALAEDDIREVARIVRAGKEADGSPPAVSDVGSLLERPDLIVDCGGHAALAQHGSKALALGIDVLTVSLGALAEQDLHNRLEAAADDGGARLHLCSGAIGGLDALRAASMGGLDDVTYIGRKPPKGWAGSPAEERVDLSTLTVPATHFEGTARHAALDYPKNANVAAAVALAGIGFDQTRVRLIADPGVSENVHEITANGAFGHLTFTIAGAGLPENPRSSALAAMSVVAEIRRLKARISF
ncbi:MAG: aspartate dehydrogenase [Pseudomonadota bacterium]